MGINFSKHYIKKYPLAGAVPASVDLNPERASFTLNPLQQYSKSSRFECFGHKNLYLAMTWK